MLLGLELLLESFTLEFAAFNFVILIFFIFEFVIRFNFRRFQYFKSWGLFVDFPIIVIEIILLWQVYATYFAPPAGDVIFRPGFSIDHYLLLLEAQESSVPEWMETAALWKGLRLLRLLRIFKLLRDVAHRKKVWEQRFTSILAYIRAFVEALLILGGVLLSVVVLTKFVTSQDPETLIRAFVDNVLARLRANQDTGVKNSDVLQAIYQVFTILAGMIILAFFTQLLLPIARRIQATQEEIKQEQGKSEHVIIAVADDDAVGLVEEALQVWGVDLGKEIVVLLPEDTDHDEPLHPKCSPEIIKGPIFSRGSWLAADSSGAEQILILSTSEIESTSISIFLPKFSEKIGEPKVTILMQNFEPGFQMSFDSKGVKYVSVSADSLVEAIEENITDIDSVQFGFIQQIDEKLDANANVLNATKPALEVDADAFAIALGEHLSGTAEIENVHCRAQDGFVLVELEGDPTERLEGGLIEAVQIFLGSVELSPSIYIFVDSLHLVGVNAQLDEESSVRIIPIELLVMYALYHETICPSITKGWLLPARALIDLTAVSKLASPFSRTTYRNRVELSQELAATAVEPIVLGLMSSNNGGVFKAYLTDTLDKRKVFKHDLIVAIV